jgi:hypothetical protein
VTRILAIADETTAALSPQAIKEIAPDVVVSCGDLPFSYVEYVASAANRGVLFVPGNHDPSLKREPASPVHPMTFEHEWNRQKGPVGGFNLDGRIVEEHGLTFAGLGGSIRYRPGANQYSERHMWWKVAALRARRRLRALRGKGRIDVLVTHSPPRGIGDMDDKAHRGFESYRGLIESFRPQVMLHGHIHPHGFDKPDRVLGDVRIINVVPYRVIEVTP